MVRKSSVFHNRFEINFFRVMEKIWELKTEEHRSKLIYITATDSKTSINTRNRLYLYPYSVVKYPSKKVLNLNY